MFGMGTGGALQPLSPEIMYGADSHLLVLRSMLSLCLAFAQLSSRTSFSFPLPLSLPRSSVFRSGFALCQSRLSAH